MAQPFDGRLAGFSKASPRAETQGSATLQLQTVALDVIGRASQSRDATLRHAAGIAALILRRYEVAVTNLDEAARWTSNAAYWSDLAVAHLARGDSERDSHQITVALAAVDVALRIEPESPEALFNRAIVLERLPLREHALVAWINYLRVDSDSRWAEEARHRLAQLQAQPRERWEQFLPAFDTPDGATATLRTAVHLYPEEARRRTETMVLGRWAAAQLARDRASAEQWLAKARTIASALVERNGDAMLDAAIRAIDMANENQMLALARAHKLYDDGRRAFGERRVIDALACFRLASAEFRAGSSPMALVSDYYAASCLDDANNDAALREIQQLLRVVPEQYASLRAQLLWQLAAIHVRRGKTFDGLYAYHRALAIFDGLGESDSATRMRNALAAVNTVIGRTSEAQRLRHDAFKALNEAGDARAIQAALELAGRAEAVEGHWQEALSLFSLARDERLRINPRVHISALVWSALAAHRIAESAAALPLLAEARRYIRTLPDASLRETAQDDLTFVEGSIRRSTEPARAAALFDRYVRSSLARRRTTFLAEAYLEQARAVRAGGNRNAAAALYHRAIGEVAIRREGAARGGIIDAYFATTEAASYELVDLLESQGRVEEAFGALDRSRGRTLAELESGAVVADSLNAAAIRSRLMPGTTAIEYLALPDRLLIFTIDTRSGPRLRTVPVRADRLQATIDGFARALRSGDENTASRLGAELYGQLIAPIADRIASARALVIVPAEGMAAIPFAALRDANGHYLIERASIVYAPSVETFTRGRSREPARDGVLVIGDPDFDRSRFPLPELPGAKKEAMLVTREHAGATLLAGSEATPRRVLAAMHECRIVHVAAHAVVVPRDPMRSFLLLTDDGSESGLLYASDIAAQRITANVVFLAACRSAALSQARGDVAALSLVFLAAGAHNVVGALWDLDDRSAPTVAASFHHHLAAGLDPAEALRQTQLQSLRRIPLATWSALTLSTIGSSERQTPGKSRMLSLKSESDRRNEQ